MRSGAKNIVVFLPIVILAFTATKTASGGEFCKWTDENGVVHYDVNCEDEPPHARDLKTLAKCQPNNLTPCASKNVKNS